MSLAPLISRRVRVFDRAVHARVAGGPGPATVPDAVLVHGLGVASRYMEPLAARLGTRMRVHVPDLPGFGRSEDPAAGVLGIDGLAEALLGYLDAAGLERAALVGNSMGCQIAVQAAVRAPTRVARLVLQGPTVDPAARTVAGQGWRWLRNAPHDRPAMARIIASDYRAAGLRRVRRTFAAALGDRPEDKLAAVVAPVLVVRGERDPISSRAWARRVAELAPHGRLVEIPQAGHTLNFSAPERLAQAVLAFVLEEAP